ncbi:MAG TPA: phosphatase PAP2 family protein [Chloroflexia bacterium]|nr:phosphatase PAP2 family protein [Chloroflexia bacterium]
MDTIIEFIAEYFFVVVILLAGVIVLVNYRRQLPGLIITGLVVGILSYLLSKLATALISDPRPFIVTGQPALIKSATDNGFPSDHTLLLAIVAATLVTVNRKLGALFLGLALLVGLARVYVRVHHLWDIIGSIVIVGIVLCLYLVGKAAVERRWFARTVSASSSK